jgi:primosomal protein N' (replication factor Y)
MEIYRLRCANVLRGKRTSQPINISTKLSTDLLSQAIRSNPAAPSIARVALDVPLAKLFDYSAQAVSAADIGARVVVPFGTRRQIGIIIEQSDKPEVSADRLKPIASVLRDGVTLPADLLEFFRFCSEYYHHPLGQVILNALPQALRRPRPVCARQLAFRLTAVGSRVNLVELPFRSLKRRLLAALRCGQILTAAEVRAISPRAPAAIEEMRNLAWVRECAQAEQISCTPATAGPALNEEQARAVGEIACSLNRFRVFLLHGVTGSGKTEVYLKLVEQVVGAGGQALVLAPEISLTPQLFDQFQGRFPQIRIARLHSAVSERERLADWVAARRGEARIVIGTRLAVFTPLTRLSLVVVDEEHDPSFKQQDGLRYSARDLAIVRAQRAGCPAVLGSATPSLESYARSLNHRYSLLLLPKRAVPQAALPNVSAINLSHEQARDGLSESLIQALQQRLVRGEQSLVFINRRGYAPTLLCPACGWTAPCARCSSHLVLHLRDPWLRCHLCGHAEHPPRACPVCGNQDLQAIGHGTQRIESALEKRFPAARILRIDRDSTRAKGAWPRLLEEITSGAADILVGTQMLTKGHDFPRLTLVGVINPDASLCSSDFRASERLFGQLLQVAGRAGRAQLPGEVLIQTRFPGHPLFEALAAQDFAGFAQALLAERRQAGFPPFVHQALLRAEARRLEVALEYLRDAAQLARKIGDSVTVYDPAPAPITRFRGRERAHLLLQSRSRRKLQAFLGDWHPKLKPRPAVRVALDVDPLEF